MDRAHYEEMVSNLDRLTSTHAIQNKIIYLFGHCNASEELAALILKKGYTVRAVLDNNAEKQGSTCYGIPIASPKMILYEPQEHTVVCIAARAFEAMKEQLRKIGYQGEVYKLVDYNSYAEYSLSEDTIMRRQERVKEGILLKQHLEGKYPDCFKVLCPFAALGDIFLAMSYLPYFLEKRNVCRCVIGVVGNVCAQVAELFQPDISGLHKESLSNQKQVYIEAFSQKNMDELVQACIYTKDRNSFIAHQDRPYVVNLHKALYMKCISLEQIYCCGVFGLPANIEPVRPREERLKPYSGLQDISKGKAVILSPYAKSVPTLPKSLWRQIVRHYKDKGYQCFTNVVGTEQALEGTLRISPVICQLQSAAEYAGTFIGIRSGLCDVLKYSECKKIALYPDYHYSDTRWKAIDMYPLEGWENIVVRDELQWEKGL
jgi:hypothetical protein